MVSIEPTKEEIPQGESVLNPWLVELMNQHQISGKVNALTMMEFNKQHTSFTLDSMNKSINVRSRRPKDSKDNIKLTPFDVLV